MKVCIACSHGGHLTEMLYLMDVFAGHEIVFITYDNFRTRNLKYKHYLFPNFGEKPWKMLFNLPGLIGIMLREKPDIVFSNGAEIAIPIFYIGKLLGKKNIFVECYTRVDMPTVTGRIVYPVCDLFLVLWPDLLARYGKKARYLGGLLVFGKPSETGITPGTGRLASTGKDAGEAKPQIVA